MSKIKKYLLFLPLLALFIPDTGIAQLSPEIQLGARGVISFNLDFLREQTFSAVNDFSDSSLLFGFRQKLYGAWRGQFVLGFQFPDADSDLGQIYFHQIFLKIEDKSSIFKIGRSRVKSALIEFPTLRDDDALYFTDVLNPFSTGGNTEESQFGNVLELAHVFKQKFWLRIHGEHFYKAPEQPEESETDFSLNAIGMSFEYRIPKAQRWNRTVLNQVGFSLNNFITQREGFTQIADRALKNIVVSTILNVLPDPVHFIDLRHQAIFNMGFEEVNVLENYRAMTRAKSLSVFTSLRYLYRKLERPTAQISASFGYKNFPELAQKTRQVQFIGNVFYRLGENFDVGLQVQHLLFKGDLQELFGNAETRIQFSLVFSVDHSWNNQFDDRDSLLNLEHGYIK